MRLLFCLLLVCSLLSGCRQFPAASQSSVPAMSSISSVSSQAPQQPQSSAASREPAAPVSSQSSEAEQVSDSVTPVEELRERLWINFEKPLYGAETRWLYIWVNNKSNEPVYVMQTHSVERLTDEGWLQIGEEMSFENPSLQVPVEPEESRLVGVYMGWLGEYSERYGDMRIPAGDYRVKLTINRDLVFDVPFSVQEDPLEPDTTMFELRTLQKSYAPDVQSIGYELINKTDHEITFSYACLLEKWDGTVWKRYTVPGSYPTFVLNLRPGESVRESFSLAGLEEPLEEGKYRLVKTVVRNSYYAEFEVSDGVIVRPNDEDEEDEEEE